MQLLIFFFQKAFLRENRKQKKSRIFFAGKFYANFIIFVGKNIIFMLLYDFMTPGLPGIFQQMKYNCLEEN